MNNIKQRAHEYAVAHNNKNDGISLMRAYVAGAASERKIIFQRHNIHPRIFISGKITGLGYLVAYHRFASAEKKLSRMGYNVANPMCICNKNWSWLRCMVVCLWNLLFCPTIYMLDGWEDSRGAKIEHRVARLLGKNITYQKKE